MKKASIAAQASGLLKPTTRPSPLASTVGSEDHPTYGAPTEAPVQVTLYMPPSLLLQVDELLLDLKRKGVNMKRAEVVRALLGALIDSHLDLGSVRSEEDLQATLTTKLKP